MKVIDYLGIIPARGGSKTIPLKNLYPINGRPLINYTLNAAKDALEHYLVSTDDERILEHCRALGHDSGYERPAEYAQDHSHRNEVVSDILKFYERKGFKVENIVYLQPTSPLRDGRHIKEAIKTHKESAKSSVVSVNESLEHPYECVSLDKNGIVENMADYQAAGARQKYDKEWFFDNGAIYIFNVETFRKIDNFYSPEDVALYRMQKRYSLDVNDHEEMFMAEAILKSLDAP